MRIAFFDRERERLFAIHVATGVQRGNRDRHVPMVGRADRDDVRLLALEHLAIVAVHRQLVVELGIEFGGNGPRRHRTRRSCGRARAACMAIAPPCEKAPRLPPTPIAATVCLPSSFGIDLFGLGENIWDGQPERTGGCRSLEKLTTIGYSWTISPRWDSFGCDLVNACVLVRLVPVSKWWTGTWAVLTEFG